MEETVILEAGQAEISKRLDHFLNEEIEDLTRSHLQKLILEGHVLVNDQISKANYKLKIGDEIRIVIPAAEELKVEAEDIPLDILYEDSDLIVINKVQGMVVHPAPGNTSGTLVNALLYHCKDLSGINGVMRPGIVHRLDKDTSGAILVAKNDLAHLSLARQLKDRTVSRTYWALVHNRMQEPGGIIDAPIGRDPSDRKKMAVTNKNSKRAVTHYKLLESFREYSLVECKLETGRTHQIRVHMAYLNHPVVGDPKYGPRKQHLGMKGQALHAVSLSFVHPRSNQEMKLDAPLPEYYLHALGELRNFEGAK